MINLKKILAFLFIIAVLSINITALKPEKLNILNDFVKYSENPNRVANILNTSNEELEKKIQSQGINLLAVNEDNTKQIQLTVTETDFSKAVQNFSNLSDDSIKALLPEITGLNNIKGEIINYDSQKYVKISIKTQDESFVLTQYFSVIDTKMHTVSFYTDCDESTDYIENVFPKEIKKADNKDWISYLIIAGIVVFSIVCLILVYTIIRDLANSKNEE